MSYDPYEDDSEILSEDEVLDYDYEPELPEDREIGLMDSQSDLYDETYDFPEIEYDPEDFDDEVYEPYDPFD